MCSVRCSLFHCAGMWPCLLVAWCILCQWACADVTLVAHGKCLSFGKMSQPGENVSCNKIESRLVENCLSSRKNFSTRENVSVHEIESWLVENCLSSRKNFSTRKNVSVHEIESRLIKNVLAWEHISHNFPHLQERRCVVRQGRPQLRAQAGGRAQRDPCWPAASVRDLAASVWWWVFGQPTVPATV